EGAGSRSGSRPEFPRARASSCATGGRCTAGRPRPWGPAGRHLTRGNAGEDAISPVTTIERVYAEYCDDDTPDADRVEFVFHTDYGFLIYVMQQTHWFRLWS